MNKIRLGIIGTGRRGFAMLKLFTRNPGYRVCALCDIDPAALDVARELLDENELAFSGEFFADPDEFLACGRLDTVYISTPDNRHVAVCVKALERNIPVLCEKPLATTVADCLVIGAAAEKSAALFYLGFNLRHLPGYVRLKDAIAAGKLGAIHLLSGREYYYGGGTYFLRWNRFEEAGGGMFVTKLTHDFDILRYVTGRKITAVAAMGGLSVFRPDVENPDDENRPYAAIVAKERQRQLRVSGKTDLADNAYTSRKDTIDNAGLLLDFEGDLRGTYHFCVFNSSGTDGRYLEVIGDRGHAVLSLNPQKLIIYDRHSGRAETEEFDTGGSHGGCDERLVEEFRKAVTNCAPPLATWKDGLDSVKVGLAARKACKTGTVVAVDYA